MGDRNLVFSMSLDNIISNNPLTEVNVIPGQWIPIRVTVDIKKEKLEIQIGEYVKKWNSSKVREFDDVSIVFGKNDYLKKQVIDVPDMTIKDLSILWFDKSEESANNNRGVALSKIRQIMEEVGRIQFDKKGTYWSIEFKENIYCDYYESLVLMEKIKENNAPNISDVKKLLSIVTTGELLPNVQTEWGDVFKSDFSNELVDLILKLIRQKEAMFSDDIYFDMANALFIHDPLNEDALKLKCRVLVKMGKNGLAGNTYAAFVKEYAALFGSDYKYSFDQILNQL